MLVYASIGFFSSQIFRLVFSCYALSKDMTEIKISVTNSANEKLVGIECVPRDKRMYYTTVLLVHGFGVEKEEHGMFTELAKHLCEKGMIVYRFDFSGCGESEGDYRDTTLTKLKSDLQCIFEFIRSQPNVDKENIGVLGQSLGTATTITLAPEVKTMIMTGAVSRPKEVLTRAFGDNYHPDGVSIREKSDGKIVYINPPFWKDFDNHNLLDSMRSITCPVLFIHGSKDEKVPISDMEAYFAAANEPKEKVIIEGADHGLRPHREKMYAMAVEWFIKWLQ